MSKFNEILKMEVKYLTIMHIFLYENYIKLLKHKGNKGVDGDMLKIYLSQKNKIYLGFCVVLLSSFRLLNNLVPHGFLKRSADG